MDQLTGAIPELNQVPDKDSKEEGAQPNQPKKKKTLDRETIDCMKEAMRELIDPIEDKINMLLATKEKQEKQELEIEKIKSTQSELYRKCAKIERDQK